MAAPLSGLGPFGRQIRDQAVQDRSFVLGSSVDPREPGAFRSALQGVASEVTRGIIPRALPGAMPRLEPSEFTPEEMERFMSYPPERRARLLMERPGMLAAPWMTPERFDFLMGRAEGGAHLASAGQQLLSPEGELIGEQVPFKSESEKLIATYLKGTKNRVWTTEAEIIANPNLYEPMEKTGLTVNVGERQEKTAQVRGGTAAIGDIMRRLRAAPEYVTGLRGGFGSFVGGLAAQVDAGMAESISRFIISADPNSSFSRTDLEELRTGMTLTAAQNIAIVTGEQTGRISEPERRMAFKASGVIGADSDRIKVQAALRTIAGLRIVNDEILRAEQDLPPDFPVTTDEEVEASRETLLAQGFSEEDADKILARLMQAGIGAQE